MQINDRRKEMIRWAGYISTANEFGGQSGLISYLNKFYGSKLDRMIMATGGIISNTGERRKELLEKFERKYRKDEKLMEKLNAAIDLVDEKRKRAGG